MRTPEFLLDSRFKPPRSKPHDLATAAWVLWTMAWLTVLPAGEGVWWVLGAFAGLELAGGLLSKGKPYGGTLSEVVWWYVPWLPVRWAFAVLLAGSAMVYVDPRAGGVLFLWLVPHFVMKGREYVRYERRVAMYAAGAYTRNPELHPSSVRYLEERVEDPTLLRDAQRLYVELGRHQASLKHMRYVSDAINGPGDATELEQAPE